MKKYLRAAIATRRRLVYVLGTIPLMVGVLAIAAPAQAADSFSCRGEQVGNTMSFHCWGASGDYRLRINCQREDRPLQTYHAFGEWRRFGGPNPSVARCTGSDYYIGGAYVSST